MGSPPTMALRSRPCAAATPALRSKPCVATQTGPKGFKRNPLESCVFLLLEDRGFAGLRWTCFSSLDDRREVPPLRRFPRCGITTREKRLAVFHLLLGVTSERDLLAFTPCRSIPPRKKYKKPTETARLRSLKTAVKNGAEREVRDQRLESRGEGTA